jgi:hypothetical protein
LAADLGQPVVAAAKIGAGEPAVGGAGGGLLAAAHVGEGKNQQGGTRSESKGWQRLLPHRGSRRREQAPEQQIRGSRGGQAIAAVQQARRATTELARSDGGRKQDLSNSMGVFASVGEGCLAVY